MLKLPTTVIMRVFLPEPDALVKEGPFRERAIIVRKAGFFCEYDKLAW
jgi:hypothetical protein